MTKSANEGVGSGVRRSQAERRRRSTKQVLNAAIKLFAERGYSHTTLAEIGEAAGYSRNIVRELFGSKEAIFVPVFNTISDTLARYRLPAMEGRVGLNAVLAFAESYLTAVENSSEQIRAIYQLRMEATTVVPQFRETFQKADAGYRVLMKSAIQQGIDAGEVDKSLQPTETATLVVSMLRGLVIQWLMAPDRVNTTALRPFVREMILRMLRPLKTDGAE